MQGSVFDSPATGRAWGENQAGLGARSSGRLRTRYWDRATATGTCPTSADGDTRPVLASSSCCSSTGLIPSDAVVRLSRMLHETPDRSSIRETALSQSTTDRCRDLSENGFVVLPSALDSSMLQRLCSFADSHLASEEEQHFEQFRFHGSMLPLSLSDSIVRELASSSVILTELKALGFAQPKWLSGYIISKPPESPPLWWHQDWWAWDEPTSFEPMPPQLFVMYYLTDVGPENGCLRVIPGSHRMQHPLHSALPEAHGPEIGMHSLTDVAHGPREDEVSVCVRAGDAILGDARLLHATHPNSSASRRTCLTTWYLPTFDKLPSSLKAYIIGHPALPPAGWWNDPETTVSRDLHDLLPIYGGSAQPAKYNRVPPTCWPAH
jgi:hypothetical protein